MTGAELESVGFWVILAVLAGLIAVLAIVGAVHLADTYRHEGRHEWRGYGLEWDEGELWPESFPIAPRRPEGAFRQDGTPEPAERRSVDERAISSDSSSEARS